MDKTADIAPGASELKTTLCGYRFAPVVVFGDREYPRRRLRKVFSNAIDCILYCKRFCERYNRIKLIYPSLSGDDRLLYYSASGYDWREGVKDYGLVFCDFDRKVNQDALMGKSAEIITRESGTGMMLVDERDIDYKKVAGIAVFVIASIVYQIVAFKYLIPYQTALTMAQYPGYEMLYTFHDFYQMAYFTNVFLLSVLMWFFVMIIVATMILFVKFFFEDIYER